MQISRGMVSVVSQFCVPKSIHPLSHKIYLHSAFRLPSVNRSNYKPRGCLRYPLYDAQTCSDKYENHKVRDSLCAYVAVFYCDATEKNVKRDHPRSHRTPTIIGYIRISHAYVMFSEVLALLWKKRLYNFRKPHLHQAT